MKNVDVLILNLNEIDVVEQSLRRLKKEGWNVIVVDNGSDDDSFVRLQKQNGISLVRNATNNGPSVGRNTGLEATDKEFVFLLDGDILYIPGTIDAMLRLMPDDAGCLGVHNTTKWDGTRQIDEADPVWPEKHSQPLSDFPMAWTQYGLFRGEFLRHVRFYEEGVFGEAGNGWEDNFLYLDMLKQDYQSYYIDGVLYYHEAHGGQKWLTEKGVANRNAERKAIFQAAWDEWHNLTTTKE